MPQGLDVTLATIRPAFGLVKPQTQDIWPQHAFTPHMWVEYLWISLVKNWAQGGYGLGETAKSGPYWPESTRARRSVSVESWPSAPGESVETVSPDDSVICTACAEARIFAVACLPSV